MGVHTFCSAGSGQIGGAQYRCNRGLWFHPLPRIGTARTVDLVNKHHNVQHPSYKSTQARDARNTGVKKQAAPKPKKGC